MSKESVQKKLLDVAQIEFEKWWDSKQIGLRDNVSDEEEQYWKEIFMIGYHAGYVSAAKDAVAIISK